jgi:membrane fusion protein, multidrug efflux system
MPTRITEPEAEPQAEPARPDEQQPRTAPEPGARNLGPAPQPSQPQAEEEGRESPSIWSQPKSRWALLVVAAVLVVAGLLWYWHFHGRESTDDAQVDGHLSPVSAKISGNVTKVLVDDNQAVKAGQVLVEIDPRDLQAKVDQQRAALATAQARAHSASIGVPLQQETTQTGQSSASANLQSALAQQASAEINYQQALSADLAYARTQVDKAQAAYDKAHTDVERMRPLDAKEEISHQQFDAYLATERETLSELNAAKQRLLQAEQNSSVAQSNVEAAAAKVASAQAGVQQAKANQKQVRERAADAAAAAAAVQQAQADLETAELNLSYTQVFAPVDGVVTDKTVQIGQVVQPGQELMLIIPLKEVWVTANFKETQLRHVVPGQKAEVHVDMYGKTFPGHVDSIAGATGSRLSLLPPENATGNFVKVVQRIPVKIVLEPIPPDKAILRPGMNVDATIFTR